MTTDTTPRNARPALDAKQRAILNDGTEALDHMKKTFSHYVAIGRTLVMLKDVADAVPDKNKNTFAELREENGFDKIDKHTVSRLVNQIMPNLEAIDAWRATLTEEQRFAWCSPDAICRHFPGFKLEREKAKAGKPEKLSPYRKLEEVNRDLQDEIEQLKHPVTPYPAGEQPAWASSPAAVPVPGQLTFSFALPSSGKITGKIIKGIASELRERLPMYEREMLASALMQPDEPTPEPTKPSKAKKAKASKLVKAMSKPKAEPSKPKRKTKAQREAEQAAEAQRRQETIQPDIDATLDELPELGTNGPPPELATALKANAKLADDLDLPEFLDRREHPADAAAPELVPDDAVEILPAAVPGAPLDWTENTDPEDRKRQPFAKAGAGMYLAKVLCRNSYRASYRQANGDYEHIGTVKTMAEAKALAEQDWLTRQTLVH